MNRILRCWAIGVVVPLLAAVAGAQPAAEKKEEKKAAADLTAEQIIDRSIEATGGRAAYEKLSSRVSKVEVELAEQGIKGTGDVYEKAPNKQFTQLTLTGVGDFYEGYDGKSGWANDPFNGLRDLAGVELSDIKREADFRGDLSWKEHFTKAEVTGKDKVGESEVYVVKLTQAQGQPIVRYYDTKTFLLLRQDMVKEGPQGTAPVSIYLSDYREVDGVKMPFQSKLTNPAFTLLFKITEVKHNVPIDDAKFAKPAAAPAK